MKLSGTTSRPTASLAAVVLAAAPLIGFTLAGSTPAHAADRGSYIFTKSHYFVDDSGSDGRAALGDKIVYTFKVANKGTVPLTIVRITDRKLDAAGVAVSCDTKTVPVGGSTTCKSQPYTVRTADLSLPQLVNLAEVLVADPQGDLPVKDDMDVINTGRGENLAGLSITPTAEIVSDKGKAGVAETGDKISYTFVVKNLGRTSLSEITVADTVLAAADIDISCPATTLSAGDSMTCKGGETYTVRSADAESNELANRATVSATSAGQSITDAASVVVATGTTPVVDNPTPPPAPSGPKVTNKLDLEGDLVFTKDQDKDGKADKGDKFKIAYSVSSSSAAPIYDVSIASKQLKAAGMDVTCDTNKIDPGSKVGCETEEYTTTAFAAAKGELSFTASALGSSSGTPIASSPLTVSVPTDTATTPARAQASAGPKTGTSAAAGESGNRASSMSSPTSIPSGVPVVGGKDAKGVIAGSLVALVAAGAGAYYYLRRRG